MGQVFLIPAQQIERSSKNIEGEIALRSKKGFVIIQVKTFDRLRFDAALK